MNQTAEIKLFIELDEKKIPVGIKWNATDSGSEENQIAEAFLLSLWDSNAKNTIGIDLWTDKMMIDEMKIYYFQTLMKMADTYENSTNKKNLAEMIRKFANEFAEAANKEE